jgi:hypothetical protein
MCVEGGSAVDCLRVVSIELERVQIQLVPSDAVLPPMTGRSLCGRKWQATSQPEYLTA